VAETCEFEEIAHLLVHGTLPTLAELAAYKAKLRSLRGLPQTVKRTLELLPAATHPMDVLRSGVSAMGCVLPEATDHNIPGARDIADRLIASLGSMLLYCIILPITAVVSTLRLTMSRSAATSCTSCTARNRSRRM